jgi:hypothetical protein
MNKKLVKSWIFKMVTMFVSICCIGFSVRSDIKNEINVEFSKFINHNIGKLLKDILCIIETHEQEHQQALNEIITQVSEEKDLTQNKMVLKQQNDNEQVEKMDLGVDNDD